MAGAVLAGGKSSRFGRDKTRLPLGGLGLASRLSAAQLEAGLDPLFLCADRAPEDLPPGVLLLPDQTPGLGPMGALATLLGRVQGPVLVTAGDMPGLDSAAIRALASAWRPGLGALVAEAADGLHPLFAIYEPGLLGGLQARLDSGRRSLRAWIGDEGLPRWPLPDPNWGVNINTKEDWERWLERK